MNPDTLHKLQVAAFWLIALALVSLNVLLALAMLELSEFLPELLEAIEALRGAL